MIKKISLVFVILVISIFLVKGGFIVFAQDDPYSPLKAAVNQLPADAGVLIVLPNGETISKNAGNQFPSFSVIKLWIAAAVLNDFKNQGTQPDSNTLLLIENMLKNSDNDAANQLIDMLGGCSNGRCDERLQSFMAENGFDRTYLRRKMLDTPSAQNDNLTSPQDGIKFMQDLMSYNIVDRQTSNLLIGMLQIRTASGNDPFKPNTPLPPEAYYIGKSGILGNGRNEVGTLTNKQSQPIFLAVFVPNGGAGTEKIISNIEQLAFDPASTPQTFTSSNSQTPSTTAGSQYSTTARACVKVGQPTDDKPAICNQVTTGFGQGVAGDFTYYCQGNPEWDQKGNACSIGQIGCGPTSLAMIFSYFGDKVTPDQMYKTYSNNGMITCAAGSFPGAVNAWVAKQPGYEVGPDIGAGVLNAVEAKKYIDAGWLILASSDNFIGQKGNPIGHIFVVQDVDPAAKTFILRDPENCSYSTGQELSQNVVQPILGGKVPSWKYAYPIRKQSTAPQPSGVNQNAF